jgi:hypothetical protein
MIADDGNEGGGLHIMYRGEEIGDISRDVIRVIVHPSVKAIEDMAFRGCSQLTTSILAMDSRR